MRARHRRAGLTIDDAGVCSVCRSFDEVAPQTEAWFKTEADLDARLADARARSTGDYDCLHLLSGGKDSSYALYQLVERGWRVHALTLDNGFISEGAKENIRSSIDALGITHEFATTEAMNEIFRDSLDRHSNVCQGCYKTIYTMAVARAEELGIPVIVTGLSRGQFFETRLIPAQFESGRFDPDAIDATVLEARKVYHQVPDAVTELLPEQRVFDDDIGVRTDRVRRLLPLCRRRSHRAVPVSRGERTVGPTGRHRTLDQLPHQRGGDPGPPGRARLSQLRRALQLGRPARAQDP